MTPYQGSGGSQAVEVSDCLTNYRSWRRVSQTHIHIGFLYSRQFVVEPELYKNIHLSCLGGLRRHPSRSSQWGCWNISNCWNGFPSQVSRFRKRCRGRYERNSGSNKGQFWENWKDVGASYEGKFGREQRTSVNNVAGAMWKELGSGVSTSTVRPRYGTLPKLRQ